MGRDYGGGTPDGFFLSCDDYNYAVNTDGRGPYYAGVGWDHFGRQLLVSTCFLIGMGLISKITGPIHQASIKKRGAYFEFVRKFMGIGSSAPEYPLFNGLLYAVNMLLSMGSGTQHLGFGSAHEGGCLIFGIHNDARSGLLDSENVLAM